MSYRADALEAFDSMTRHQWVWFCPRQFSPTKRDEFRALIEAGRVDPREVLHNVDVAATVEAIHEALGEASSKRIKMAVRRKGTGAIADLRVIA